MNEELTQLAKDIGQEITELGSKVYRVEATMNLIFSERMDRHLMKFNRAEINQLITQLRNYRLRMLAQNTPSVEMRLSTKINEPLTTSVVMFELYEQLYESLFGKEVLNITSTRDMITLLQMREIATIPVAKKLADFTGQAYSIVLSVMDRENSKLSPPHVTLRLPAKFNDYISLFGVTRNEVDGFLKSLVTKDNPNVVVTFNVGATINQKEGK